MHALTTLNDITYMEAARVMAARILLAESTDAGRLNLAFELSTSRIPGQQEYSILEQRLNKLRDQYASTPDDAIKITGIGESPVEEQLDLVEHATYTALCSVLLNLDETITRQ